jgi:predicted TIM-barrel fold metal-dependent hydrolase
MIIDFHTHVFPDNLAERALSVLLNNLNNSISPVNNATVSGLLKNMDQWNIDISVAQPILTKQSQTKNTNEWARSICSGRIISFGSIYPHTDDYKRDIDFVVSLGLKGIKFHAGYQNFIVDDERMLKIYDHALSKGLIIMHHAGEDIGMPTLNKNTPRQYAKIADAMKGGVIVAAHLGGLKQWDDVEKYLVGKNIYLDTSMGFDYFGNEQFLRIIKKHGIDKILFASDSPWSNAKTEMEHINSLPISEDEKKKIFCDNAKRLLNI